MPVARRGECDCIVCRKLFVGPPAHVGWLEMPGGSRRNKRDLRRKLKYAPQFYPRRRVLARWPAQRTVPLGGGPAPIRRPESGPKTGSTTSAGSGRLPAPEGKFRRCRLLVDRHFHRPRALVQPFLDVRPVAGFANPNIGRSVAVRIPAIGCWSIARKPVRPCGRSLTWADVPGTSAVEERRKRRPRRSFRLRLPSHPHPFRRLRLPFPRLRCPSRRLSRSFRRRRNSSLRSPFRRPCPSRRPMDETRPCRRLRPRRLWREGRCRDGQARKRCTGDRRAMQWPRRLETARLQSARPGQTV